MPDHWALDSSRRLFCELRKELNPGVYALLTGSVVRDSRDLGQARRTGTGPQAHWEPQEIPAWALSAPRFQITKSGGEQAIKKSGGEL